MTYFLSPRATLSANSSGAFESRVEHGPERCDTPTVQETELQEAVMKAINMALGGKDDMLVALGQNIASVLALEDEGSIESINAKLEELQNKLLKRANAKKIIMILLMK